MKKTVVRHASDADFEVGLRPFFAYRDLGVKKVTAGEIGAHVVRAVPGMHAEPQWHSHDVSFQLVYVLRGWVEFEYEDAGLVRLEPGSSVYQAPGVRHREIAHSDDLELLEITAPGEFATALVSAPESVSA